MDDPRATLPGPEAGSDDLNAVEADDPAKRDPEALESGSHVGRYVILYRLGRGGMGIVFAAYDPQLDRKIAIKVMRKRRGDRAPHDSKGHMLREAQLLAKLSHPNVVAIHDVGIVREQLFVAMEYIEGQTLRRWLHAGERSIAQIVTAFAQAAEGLAAAHHAGIVHRDFKPDNAIIDQAGRVHVLDFGLARVQEHSDDRAIVMGRIEGGVEPVSDPVTPAKTKIGMQGTPAYMSPEQHLGESAGPASDQFSLCVALYEALFGRAPFAGADHAELALEVTHGRIRDPPRHTKVPARLRHIVWTGLNVEPSQRHPSMDVLAAELRRAPARGRAAWIAATVLVLAGGGAWWSGLAARRAGPCSDGASAALGAWDDTRRDEVTHTFEASRRAYAPKTLAVVTTRLDEYSSAWVEAWTDACEATHVRHEQSGELLDLRMACLRRTVDELGALTRLLAEADDEVVDRASMAVDALPDLRPCADAVALRERSPLPDDEVAKAQIDEQHTRLAHAAALEHAGKLDEARAVARNVVGRARTLDYPPLLAEALFVLGEILEAAAEHGEASSILREAAVHAEVARDDRLLARIRVALVLVDGDRLGKSEHGRVWADLTRATLERIGGHPELESTLENNFAFVIERDAPPEVVLEHRRRALELFEQSESRSELRRAPLLANLAGTLADLGRFDEALQHAEEAHAIWQGILGPDHRRTAIGLSTIGLVHDFAGRRDEALRWYQRAHAGLVRTLGADNLHTTEVLNNIAITSFALGDYERAETAFRKIIAIRETALGRMHPDVASAHANLAESLSRTRPEESLRHHQSALEIRKHAFGADHVTVADSMLGIANVLERLDRHREALSLRLDALEVQQTLYGPSSAKLVLPLANTAHNRLLVGDLKAARTDAERAVVLASMNEIKDDDRAFASIVLAKVLMVQRQDFARVRDLMEQARLGIGDLPAPAERQLLADIEQLQGSSRSGRERPPTGPAP